MRIVLEPLDLEPCAGNCCNGTVTPTFDPEENENLCSDGTLFLNNNYKKRFEYSPFDDEECMNCLVLPMCMGGCTYCHLKGKKFCIPEKFVLDDFIVRLYNQKMNRR